MSILQLNPPLPLETPRGSAVAHIYVDGGIESECFWVCFCEDGQIWQFANSSVRACKNITLGRTEVQKP